MTWARRTTNLLLCETCTKLSPTKETQLCLFSWDKYARTSKLCWMKNAMEEWMKDGCSQNHYFFWRKFVHIVGVQDIWIPNDLARCMSMLHPYQFLTHTYIAIGGKGKIGQTTRARWKKTNESDRENVSAKSVTENI